MLTTPRLDWTMFAVASTLDEDGANAPSVLEPIISVLKDYASSSTNNTPLGVVYNPENGVTYSGQNRLVNFVVSVILLKQDNW